MSRKLFLTYNKFWVHLPKPPPGGACHVTTDRSHLEEADAIVFHLPNLDLDAMPMRRPGQFWVGWCMESEVYYPQLDDPAFLRRFDIIASHRRSADLWLPYVGERFVARFEPRCHEKTGNVVYLQSNNFDRAGRRAYVQRLMRRVKIDSYGRSLRNRELPGDNGYDSKLDLIARYKFTLAFENSIAVDYITEKFFQPLCVGSVPVYRGAPNVRSLAPGPDCYINADDFASPDDLAAYLNHLIVTPREYEAFLAWRTRPFADGFAAALECARVSPWLRLSALVDERLAHR